MENNNYQWSKTLRFGLNRKNDEKKYKSHGELGEFLNDLKDDQKELMGLLDLEEKSQIGIKEKIKEIQDFVNKAQKESYKQTIKVL